MSPANRAAPPPSRLANCRARTLIALAKATRPWTASQVQQFALSGILNAAGTRRMLDDLVAEGRLRTRTAPGFTAVSAPVTVYELVKPEGGAS